MKHLKEFVKSVPDYRRTDKGNYKYKLEDILLLVILGRLGKCMTRPDIIRFGERNLKRFRSLGILLDGVPSEPTLCRIFKHIDDEAMSERMSEFTSTFHDELVGCAGDILCIDGKAMRGTVLENGRTPDIVSAYSLEGGFTLATDMCEEKSNEITSVPKLLDKVDVSGCIVTADAMSFQKAIIDKIREKGGDFLIELKANQRTLRYGVEDNVELAEPVDVYSEGPFLEHGRIETRVCRIFRGNDLITDRKKWNGNLTVVEIRTATERKSDGQKSSERRFYVSSFHGSARRLSTIARMHWAIESMHWDLDRNLRQDFIRRNSGSVEISWGLFFILVKYCLLRIMKNDYLNMLASLVLPAQILDYFLISGVEQTSQEIHISLDEKMNSKLSNDEHFESKGFMEAVNVTDFPIRDHKVILKIRRRRWTDLRTGKSFSIPIDLDVVAKGTRYSKEFGAFLKETYGDIPSDLPYA